MSPDSTARLQASWQAIARQSLAPAIQQRLAHASEVPLSLTARFALSHLADGTSMCVSDLATLCGVDISTMSRSLHHLDDAGYIERQHGGDQRSVLVSLTDEGARAVSKHRMAAHELLNDVLQDWSDEDREELSRLMAQFADAFNAYCRRPAREQRPVGAQTE